MKYISLSFFVIFASFALPVYAQEDAENGNPNVAALQVKLTEMEEHIRRLQGLIEKNSYENKQLQEKLEKSNADVEFRLSEIEKKQTQPVAPAAPPTTSQDIQTDTPDNDSDKLKPVSVDPVPAATNAETDKKFAKPLEHYNYAFNLVREKKYPEAASSFTAFTQSYPKDPLIGNAYYWLGETNYVRKDYLRAADNFRQGYESMPTGPKAGDNLLKLALSMNALKKQKEACVVLKQVVIKFGNSATIKGRAEQEIASIGCNGGQ